MIEDHEDIPDVQEFVCNAIPGPDVPVPPSPGACDISRVTRVMEFVEPASERPVTRERIAELRALSPADLRSLLNRSEELSDQEILVISAFAAERAAQGDPVSRATLQAIEAANLIPRARKPA